MQNPDGRRLDAESSHSARTASQHASTATNSEIAAASSSSFSQSNTSGGLPFLDIEPNASAISWDIPHIEVDFGSNTERNAAKDTKLYTVWPKHGDADNETKRIYQQMASIVDQSQIVKTSATKDFGINCWIVRLADDQVASVRNIPEVSSVRREDEGHSS